jgi:RNA recognition motif-containing protein
MSLKITKKKGNLWQGTTEIVFARREDVVSAVSRYNNFQLDGKPLKIEIVGTNIAMSLLENLTVPINYTKRIGM